MMRDTGHTTMNNSNNSNTFKRGDRVYCHAPAYGKPFSGFLGHENIDHKGERFECASNHDKNARGSSIRSKDQAFLVFRSETSGALWHKPTDFRHVKARKV